MLRLVHVNSVCSAVLVDNPVTEEAHMHMRFTLWQLTTSCVSYLMYLVTLQAWLAAHQLGFTIEGVGCVLPIIVLFVLMLFKAHAACLCLGAS